MAADGMFFIISDETIEQKGVRLLGQLRDADPSGSMAGKIESLLTGTEDDRDILVAVSMVHNSPVVVDQRRRDAEVNEGRRKAIDTNRDKAAERHGVWLPEAKLAQAERKLKGLYDAIAEGLRTHGLLRQLEDLEAERDRLAAALDGPAPTPVRLHPNLPELYRKKVARLREALQDPSIRDEAVDLLRGLMTKVTVRPGTGFVELVVEGALAAMLSLAAGARAEAFSRCSQSTAKLVAGARNYRELMPLVATI